MDYDYYDQIIADQEKNSCTAETAKILQENEMFKDYIKHSPSLLTIVLFKTIH